MEDAIFKERQERELGFRAREKVNLTYLLASHSKDFSPKTSSTLDFKS